MPPGWAGRRRAEYVRILGPPDGPFEWKAATSTNAFVLELALAAFWLALAAGYQVLTESIDSSDASTTVGNMPSAFISVQ